MARTNPIHAALYDPFSRNAVADQRRRLVADASGTVLEVGAGNGLNLRHYRNVESVCIAEPAAAMRKRLFDRVAAAAVPVSIHELPIESTGLPDATYDTVVCTFVLCTVAD